MLHRQAWRALGSLLDDGTRRDVGMGCHRTDAERPGVLGDTLQFANAADQQRLKDGQGAASRSAAGVMPPAR